MGLKDYSDGFKFKILPHRLEEPLRIKKPTKFFVNSMSDLFREEMSWGTWGADEVKRNKKANGRIFQGKKWNEYPQDYFKNQFYFTLF
jgi:protein gp37